jgi:hypothetical protein
MVQNFLKKAINKHIPMKKIIIFVSLSFLILSCSYGQSFSGNKTPYENKSIDFKIIKSGESFITADSFYNKIIKRVDTIDLESFIKRSYYEKLFSKLYIIHKVDSAGNLIFVDVTRSAIDYITEPLKKIFKNNEVVFRKDLIEDAKNKYLIQPIVIFASDKNTGPLSTNASYLAKQHKADSSKLKEFFEVISLLYLPEFFQSSPVNKKGWLTAVWLPTVYVNKGTNKYFGDAWYKELE